MQKKRIAIITGHFPSVSETFIVNQINGLLDLNTELDVYAYKKEDTTIQHESLFKYNLMEKVEYWVEFPWTRYKRPVECIKWTIKNFKNINWKLYFKTFNVFKYGDLAFSFRLFYEAQWFLLKREYQLLHVHFGKNAKRIANLKEWGFLPKTKFLITFHGFDLLPNYLEHYKGEYTNLLKQATAFTVNTPYLESLLNTINRHNKPIHVLPVGVDTSFFTKRESGTNHEKFTIVFCGRLIPLKGADRAVTIVRELLNKGYENIRLEIIGDGPQKTEIERMINRWGLQESITLHKALTQEGVLEIYSKGDVLIMPGRPDSTTGQEEAQGLVLQEAQAMGIPVIVSSVGGMKYGLLEGSTGFVVQDDIGFIENLERLINNRKLKENMGREAQRFIRENYDNKGLTKELRDIYAQIIQDN